jgi:hypothetical protein
MKALKRILEKIIDRNMQPKKMWVYSPKGKSKAKLSVWKKTAIENRCRPLVERFKRQYVNKDPDKRFNYLTDVFIKWRGNNLYFCEKLKLEQAGND